MSARSRGRSASAGLTEASLSLGTGRHICINAQKYESESVIHQRHERLRVCAQASCSGVNPGEAVNIPECGNVLVIFNFPYPLHSHFEDV
jgi:hypothetical protein